MADPTALRRSGRKRQANRKYSVDLLEELHGHSSGSDDSEIARKGADAAEEDHESANEPQHDVDYVADHDEAPNSSGNDSPAEDDVEDADSNADANFSELPPLHINDRVSDPHDQSTPKEKETRYQVRAKKDSKDIVRSRGLRELSSKNPSKEDMLKFMAGGHPQDWVDFLRVKDRWLTDPTLPTKVDAKKGKEGICHHFSHTKEKREMEATVGWNWYYDQGGRELFAKRQKTQILTPDEGLGYIPKPVEEIHKFLMGPYGNQDLFSLEKGQSMYLEDAWKSARERNQENNKPGEVRDGWMLNLGTSIKCLDWATNQDGDVQYLAAATAQPRPSAPEALSEVSPAYTPSAPIRSCIQIWEFLLQNNPTDHGTLEKSPRKPPALHLVICTEWGEIKQLKWCQMPRTFRSDYYATDKIPLGLLAGVWSDGLVRVFDVQLDKNTGTTASYVKYDEPAFKAWAPNTLCTCVTWLSASMIAVGFANGFLAIWDISQHSPASSSPPSSLTSPQTHSHPLPRPWLYHSLHQTYILALTSAYPLAPHLLSTSSVDGYTRLTDLRSAPSFADSTFSPRSRNTSPLLSFSPHTLSILSTEENDFARLFPLRSFHSSVVFARATASPLSLAANHFHPCVLIGCADGTLLATNPLPRVWSRKWAYYQQVIFRHEWMKGRAKAGGRPESESESEHEAEDRKSITRLTESYKIIQPSKSRASHPFPFSSPAPEPGKSSAQEKPEDKEKDKDRGPHPQPQPKPLLTTIYDEETGVVQLSWNPNLRFGGWMAAGMGSGLLRVQDLAV